ncbi:uncharacterized protein LOC134528194 isoform X2 [Bacillus rossius redtenbacheri]|uniref:uncharacterized protein LOC134528194 isoform X2 n=1 Tax=Bacillus rossius redtenbacheri TaxID=93214 RepID=UPI002FDCA0DF
MGRLQDGGRAGGRGARRALGAMFAAGVACLGLMTSLAVWPLCSAGFRPCSLGDRHLRRLKQIRQDSGLLDYPEDSKCCSPSSWAVDEWRGELGVYFQLPRPGKTVKKLVLEKYLGHGGWVAYTQALLGPEDYATSGGAAPPNTSTCPHYVREEFGYHTFRFISSGLYRLKSCSSAELNIKTAFNETSLNCTPHHSTFIGEYLENDTASVIFPFQQGPTFRMDKIYTLLYSNQTVVSQWTVRARKEDNDRLICEANDRRVHYDPVPNIERYEQKFKVDNLKPGFYILEVESIGQLTVEHTTLKVCKYVYEIQINVTNLPAVIKPPKLSPEENLTISFAIVLLTVVAFCSLCYLVYLLRRHFSHPQDGKKFDIISTAPARQKVLLLYARDCPQFNDLMATFRELLKKNNFEVYDCQDPQLGRRLHRGPTTWLRDRLDDCSVRLLVVSTRCARLRQSALLGGGQALYRRPHHLDPLFLYGLRGVQDVHTDVYTRIFSIALEGFTEKEDMLSLFCGSRIYSLPTHLLELYRDLRRDPQTPEETAELRAEVETLRRKLAILIGYTNKEKDYLCKKILMC